MPIQASKKTVLFYSKHTGIEDADLISLWY